MSRRSRGGRRRVQGERYPSGKLRPEVAIPPEALERRAERANCSTDEARRPEAGYALGQLLMRGIINQRQHDAGTAYRQAWMRWASLAGIPPHETAQRGHGYVGDDIPVGTWATAKQSYTWATDAVLQCEHCRLVMSAIETVVMDNVLPPLFPHRWVAVAALRAGLDVLADYYRMPRRDAA